MKKPIFIGQPRTGFLWPIKCHSVGVIATANIGMSSLKQVGAFGAAVAKTSTQPQLSFSESLSTASKASSEDGSANDGNTKTTRRQKSASEDEQTTNADHRDDATQSSVLPQQQVQPAQTIPAQQSPVSTSDSALLPSSFGGAVTTACATSDVAVKSAIVASDVIQSSNDPSQTASIPSDSGTQNIKSPGTSLFEIANSASNPGSIAVARSGSDAVSSLAQNETANTVHSVVPSTASDSLPDADSAPVLHSNLNASASAILASAARETAAAQAVPSTAPTDQALSATNLSASGETANQIVVPVQPAGGLLGTVHATVSSFKSDLRASQSISHAANGKDASKDATNDDAGLSPHAPFATDHTGSQSGSGQDAPVGDQSQNGASSQEQNAAPSQANLATNSVPAILTAHITPTASPVQSASMHAGVTASAAKLSYASDSASPAVTLASPVINSAKLIQSIGQSEMRVGMRSTEFGNISISTTANKDVISAQISLDHGELAKALAAQLPEMQARLGGNRPMDVRIDMSGVATGYGAGTSGNMSNGASDQSSTGKQQSPYTASSYSSNSIVERQSFAAAAGTTTRSDSLNARLDIRV